MKSWVFRLIISLFYFGGLTSAQYVHAIESNSLSSHGVTAESTSYELKRLSNLKKNGAQVSALIERLSDGKIISQISPNQHLIPASTTKLFSATQALKTWGPDKTFASKLLARGSIENGVLEGDLIFYGSGDPSLTNEKLVFLGGEVANSGLKKVTGRMIVNNSLFGNLSADSGRKNVGNFSSNAYDSPISSAAVNYSVLGVIVEPGSKVGAKGVISLEPYSLPSVIIVNRVKTTGPKTATKLAVDRVTQKGRDIYTVSGHIAQGASVQRIYRSVSNADRYAGEVIAAYLQHAGVDIQNNPIVVESTTPLKTDRVIATINGFSVAEQLQSLLQMSNNFIGDMYFMHFGGTEGSFERNEQKLLSDSDLVLKSGSGLTPENRVSAANLVNLLKETYQDEKQFQVILNSLTAPGEVGTLEDRFKRFSHVKNTVFFRAKTGTLTQPRLVVSLAGYAHTKSDEWVVFAFIVNLANSENAPDITALRNAVDSDLTSFLLAEGSSP